MSKRLKRPGKKNNNTSAMTDSEFANSRGSITHNPDMESQPDVTVGNANENTQSGIDPDGESKPLTQPRETKVKKQNNWFLICTMFCCVALLGAVAGAYFYF